MTSLNLDPHRESFFIFPQEGAGVQGETFLEGFLLSSLSVDSGERFFRRAGAARFLACSLTGVLISLFTGFFFGNVCSERFQSSIMTLCDICMIINRHSINDRLGGAWNDFSCAHMDAPDPICF